jgi:Protein of unknown function (DUF2934)
MELDQCPLTSDERQRMIAKAAYFRSLDRSQQSHPVEDWLAAEKEVEESIQDYCNMRPTQKKMADYQRWGLFNTAIGWWQRFKSRIIN